jgi:hypothetical protein
MTFSNLVTDSFSSCTSVVSTPREATSLPTLVSTHSGVSPSSSMDFGLSAFCSSLFARVLNDCLLLSLACQTYSTYRYSFSIRMS